MPIYEYRCECGKKVEALVRGGREPLTCDEVGDRHNFCENAGKLTRLLSAAAIGKSGGSIGGGEEATCGSCGRVPGSCAYD